MKATTIYAAHDVRLEDQPDPAIAKPSDAIVKVLAACVCGSDLWYYRGDNPIKDPFRIGHEFVGVVEDVGPDVRSLRRGDFVIAPFKYSDNTCAHCRVGIQSACSAGGFWGRPDRDGLMADGGQGEYVRVPLADGTLVTTRETPGPAMVPSLLALSDVMGTGWHAAMAARVQEGDTVVGGRRRGRTVGGTCRLADGCRTGGGDVAEPGPPAGGSVVRCHRCHRRARRGR